MTMHFQHSSAGLIFAWPYIVLGDEFAVTTEHDIASALSRSASMRRRGTFLASLLDHSGGTLAFSSGFSVEAAASAAAVPAIRLKTRSY